MWRDRRWWALPPRGWRRAVAVRRAVAGALVMLAVTLAVLPRAAPPGARVVVAAHDVAAGAAMVADDLVVRLVPADLVPAGALTDPAGVVGRLPVGGVRAGEVFTDVRLLGRAAAVAATGVPDAAGVPVRLADPAVARLLTAGTRVDVIGAGGAGSGGAGAGGAAGPVRPPPGPGSAGGAAAGSSVLAAGAVVLSVLPAVERSATGPVVVVALPGASAARVAAASLSQEVTVTLR